LFEAVRIDDTIRRLINDNADEAAIARHAFARAPNLAAAARALVAAGETTPEEAVRITRREQVDG
jgi:general secretion pathway protein E